MPLPSLAESTQTSVPSIEWAPSGCPTSSTCTLSYGETVTVEQEIEPVCPTESVAVSVATKLPASA